MKFFKKCLIVVVSLFVILATQPTNVFAESTTYTYDQLEEGMLIKKLDKIQYDAGNSESICITSEIYNQKAFPTGFTVDADCYIIGKKEETFTDYNPDPPYEPIGEVTMYIVMISYAVEVTVNENGSPIDGSPYTVPANTTFSINNNVLTVADKTYAPTIPANKFVSWTWSAENTIYTDTKYNPEVHSVRTLGDLVEQHTWKMTINCKIYDTQELGSLSISGHGTVATSSTETYNIYLIDKNGNRMDDNSRTITVVQLDESNAPISGSEKTITDDGDGYNFDLEAPNEPCTLKFKFTVNDTTPVIAASITVSVEGEEYDSVIMNNAWPWATDFGLNQVKLTTGLLDENITTETYQWQKSDDNVNYTNDGSPVATAEKTITSPTSGKWYRCVISYDDGTPHTYYTKGVQIIDPEYEATASASGLLGIYYVSNGMGAYAFEKDSGDYTGRFSVLGKWSGVWICTSYDESWSIYLKKTGATIVDEADSNIIGAEHIKDLCPRFLTYDNPNVIFDVTLDLADDVANKYDAAIYTDVSVGDWTLFGEYCDWAAVKANLNNDGTLGNIQMLTSKNFKSATEDTCAFVLTPIKKSVHNSTKVLPNVSTFTIDELNNTDWAAGFEYIWTDDGETYGTYEEVLAWQDKGIFNYHDYDEVNKGCRIYYDPEEYEDFKFVPGTVEGGKTVVAGMYGADSILAASWSNVNEFSFMFGIGKPKDVPGVNFEDIGEEEEKEHHHSGGTWIEVPNTSASTR